MKHERITLLQNMPLFGGLGKDALEILLNHAAQVTFQAGDHLVRQGGTTQSVFVLEEGSATVIKSHGDNHYQLGEVHRGDCIGELSLIDPGPRSASVIAQETCSCLCLRSADFYRLRRHDLGHFTLLQMNIAREVCRRLRSVENLMLSALEGEVDPGMMPRTVQSGA